MEARGSELCQAGQCAKAVARRSDSANLTPPNERTVMRKLNLGFLAALLVACASVATAKALTSALKAQMAANFARGDLLYDYDQTAWHITDAMTAAVPADLKKLLRGYVITPDGDDFRATFFGETRNGYSQFLRPPGTAAKLFGPSSMRPSHDRPFQQRNIT